jgi:hypothetical protein
VAEPGGWTATHGITGEKGLAGGYLDLDITARVIRA